MHFDLAKYFKNLYLAEANELPKGKWQKHLSVTRKVLEIAEGDELIMFSSETGLGKDQAWHFIERKMKE